MTPTLEWWYNCCVREVQLSPEINHLYLFHQPMPLYRQFDQLNVAILNASLIPNGAHRMAEILTKRHKLAIEKKIGAKLNICLLYTSDAADE